MAKHCFANLILGINLVKLPDIFQIANGKAFPEVFCQIGGQFFQKLCAVCRAVCAVLLFLDNHPANLKIGIDHRKIDGRFRIQP